MDDTVEQRAKHAVLEMSSRTRSCPGRAGVPPVLLPMSSGCGVWPRISARDARAPAWNVP